MIRKKRNKKAKIEVNLAIGIGLGLIVLFLLIAVAQDKIGLGFDKILNMFGKGDIKCETTGLTLKQYENDYEEFLQSYSDNSKAQITATEFSECFPTEFRKLEFGQTVTNYNHAHVLEGMGETAAARDIYEQFEGSDHELKDNAVFRLGQTYSNEEKYDDAIKIYKDYIKDNSNSDIAYFSRLELAKIYYQKKEDFLEAKKYLEEFYEELSEPKLFTDLVENLQGQDKQIEDYLEGLKILNYLYELTIYTYDIYFEKKLKVCIMLIDTKFILNDFSGMKKTYDEFIEEFKKNKRTEELNKLNTEVIKKYGKYAGKNLKCEKIDEQPLGWIIENKEQEEKVLKDWIKQDICCNHFKKCEK